MAIDLTKKTEERLREKVASGAYRSADDVIQAGLERLEESEALRAAIAEAEDQVAHGQVVPESESRRRTRELLEKLRHDA